MPADSAALDRAEALLRHCAQVVTMLREGEHDLGCCKAAVDSIDADLYAAGYGAPRVRFGPTRRERTPMPADTNPHAEVERVIVDALTAELQACGGEVVREAMSRAVLAAPHAASLAGRRTPEQGGAAVGLRAVAGQVQQPDRGIAHVVLLAVAPEDSDG